MARKETSQSIRYGRLAAILAASATLIFGAATAQAGKGVNLVQKGDHLRVEIDGKLFTKYHFDDVKLRPFFYPVFGPNEIQMTRNYPMKEGVPGESSDHSHHTGLFFAQDKVNGGFFWHDNRIKHDKFLEIESGKQSGHFTTRNRWVLEDGEVVCTDVRTCRFYATEDGRFLDFTITLKASEGEAVTIGDTKEGTMAIRVAAPLRVEGEVGNGEIVNSNGQRNRNAWGKRAKWCDYHGTVDDQQVGVSIFDHPYNPRHPTWWHVRTYGLFAANPFGIHNFEDKPEGVGDYLIPEGQKATFRYRFYFHEGDEEEANVEAHYQDFASPNPPGTGSHGKSTALKGPPAPESYHLAYSQNFEGKNPLDDFVFTDPEAWRLGSGKDGHALELYQGSDYDPPHRSPYNIALIQGKELKDFILEANLLQTGEEYGHRDMCLFFGFEDPAHYYYSHIATSTDAHAHNVFIVNEAARTKISHKTTEGIDWGDKKWHTVRIERRSEEGTIKVYFDDLEDPIMEANDKHFNGHIGFGSFDDVGKIDNIRIWAPSAKQERISEFHGK